MATNERTRQLETLWVEIRPLQQRAEQPRDHRLNKDVAALLVKISAICGGDAALKEEIGKAKTLLLLGQTQATLERARAILIEAVRVRND